MVGVGCFLNVWTLQKHASMPPEVWILGGGQTADELLSVHIIRTAQ